jgi:hypothetical protein
MQARGSDLAPSTVIFNDSRDEALRTKFATQLARLRQEAGGQVVAVGPDHVLFDDAPLQLSRNMLTLLFSENLFNSVMSRKDNPEAYAEVASWLSLLADDDAFVSLHRVC